MKPIKKILVANRGEIALRIMRTCKEMGLSSVAIFSDADRDAPHTRTADSAVHVGASPAGQSYLLHDRIIAVAKESGADAIHPGYGFLSENHEFARKVRKAGLVFIGPPHSAMQLLGDKTRARALAKKQGIPITRGTTSPVKSLDALRRLCAEIGYPVLLKAAGGGGGKGMKVVNREADLESAFTLARSEAKSAFGDDRVYVEQYIVNPRHIEVQVLADQYGNVIHLGERECSVQRRHQKIVEETPSCAIDPALRKKMTSAAIRLVKSARYYSAATVEFLLDDHGKFFFLEVNTRLQVEHPVTEMCTGIDLVREQIQIAQGTKLGYRQKEVSFRGSSLECRIYAEDPWNNFFPSTGRIEYLLAPSGPFVRVDGGIEQGQEVTPYYDPLLMKIVSWGETRRDAITRMKRSLAELRIFGVTHNAELCSWVIHHPSFAGGDFSTTFLDRNFRSGETLETKEPDIERASAVGALLKIRDTQRPSVGTPPTESRKWKSTRRSSLR